MKESIKKISIDIYIACNKSITASVVNRFLFAFCFLLLFFLYKNNIETFIEKFFLTEPNFSNIFLDVFFLMTIIIVSILLLIKILRDKYIPSYFEIFSSFLLLFFICYYGTIDKWNVLKLNIFNIQIEYLFLIGIPILLFICSIYYNWHQKKKNKSSLRLNTNQFISDDPLLKMEEDKLDSKKVANNLIQILKNENHENSFTLGLVGPWGNGKSSVINFVKDYFYENEEKDTIIIHFLPYLNHNENDIINEFFILLSNELAKYSGRVSNQLMLYSKKLSSLYKDKNIFEFLENQITKIDNTSANELYNEINKNLKEINKKIIVFVDDLDRLNEKEILQVLKLIRNTANFKNTFFVVAMDKEYVLSRLKSNSDILNSNFIDKFFQLEIYLPEIDNLILRKYFIDCLKKSTLATSDGYFENQLFESMSNSDNLFNDFVKNIRDVKRVVNQIVYDYPIFKKDIDLKDFMNFTYFKLKFPKYLKLLNDRKADFIYIDREKGTYNLIKCIEDEKPVDILDKLNKVKLHNTSFLNKYEISSTKKCLNNDLSINCEDQTLLLKTLAYLFGEENTVPSVSSIKNETNFRMLVEQRIFSHYFTQSEFEQLYDINDDYRKVSLLLASNFYQEKLSQLIKRFDDFNTNDEHKIKRTIQILIILFDQREYYKLYGTELLILLETYVQRLLSINKERIVDSSTWIQTNIFEAQELSIETRIYLFSHVWKSKADVKYWNLSDIYISTKVIELFKNYLASFQDKLWDVNFYDVYGVYHSIKDIGDLRAAINSFFIKFWNENKIELLCAQITEIEAFSKSQFKISDTAVEIFGSKQNFIEFVKNHKNNTLPEIKEFIHFFNLCEIMRHLNFVVYQFKVSILIKQKIISILESINRQGYNRLDNPSQIFFVTSSQSLSSSIFNDLQQRNYNLKTYEYMGEYFIIYTLDKNIDKSDVVKIASKISEITIIQEFWEINGFNKENVLNYENFGPQSDNKYVKLYSIQPPLK
jgi:predicted KAP-like P-loop ATPase